VTALARGLAVPRRLGAVRAAFSGVTAIGVKELRGRMRGRRAFVIVTAYLLLLAGFAWMMALILERQYAVALGGSAAFASAQIGRGVFGALLVLETVFVAVLAPAFTAGAISQEREKQTLDMLATTPISSLALVVGKLVSALTYVFVLIFASIPITAIVFMFGGVAADDVVRGYVVLVVTALGFGSVGLFFSALLQRTQAATIATYFAIVAVTAGTFFVAYFWNAMTGATDTGQATREFGPLRGRPPAALQYLNPYFAQADILCTVEDEYGEWCNRLAFIGARTSLLTFVPPEKDVPSLPIMPPGIGIAPGVNIDPGVALKRLVVVDSGAVVDPTTGRPPADGGDVGAGVDPVAVAAAAATRDQFWPKTIVAWSALSAVFVLASVQLVSPTRRWRPVLPLRRLGRRGSTEGS
jgi:ABC-type transport system involved in multi-copper enzyme maturation permease subunit